MVTKRTSRPPAASSPSGGRALSARERAEARWGMPRGRGRPGMPRGSRVFIVRDIPASCICIWDWDAQLVKWQLFEQLPGCPWHEGN